MLDNNNLNGPLPPSIGELVQIQHMGLANNQLSGLIPASVTNPTNSKAFKELLFLEFSPHFSEVKKEISGTGRSV